MKQNTLFIAHRGLSAQFPENTHAAFRAAWDKDCDGIELDIQVSRDGKVMVIHDSDTERTAGEKSIISETDYKDLLHLNVGVGGKSGDKQFDERIPLLSEVINEVPPTKLVQIEIKHQIIHMKTVIAALSTLRKDIAVQIISFDPEKLQCVRRELPHLDCFLVMDKDNPNLDDHISFALQNGLAGLDMSYHMASPEYVKSVLDAGLQVAHWTVNDTAIAKRLIAQGAKFIVSDCADILKKSLANVMK